MTTDGITEVLDGSENNSCEEIVLKSCETTRLHPQATLFGTSFAR